MSNDDIKLPDLSKEVAAYITDKCSSGQFGARHNSQVVYTMPELAELRVDVWPDSVTRSRIVRNGWSKEPVLNIAIQRIAKTQDERDILVNLSDSILATLLGKRFASGRLYCDEGGFGTSGLMDRFENYDTDAFVSVLAMNFTTVI